MPNGATVGDGNQREAWLGLTLSPGWGPVRIWRALRQPPNPQDVWRRIQNAHVSGVIQRVEATAEVLGVSIVTWDDIEYPANLRQTQNPPPVLYIQGSLLPQDAASVAIVGSRRASDHALQLSYLLSRDLAAAGVTIVSGLATGVDAAAHRGAIDAGGRTIAVVATGVDTVYPKHHAILAASVIEHGAIVSQFPFGTSAQRSHFPIRNRTMAGLALGTVVVEAPERSGALITAKCALDMGREVMVCPGDVLREHTCGSNRWLREGAQAVMSASDVLFDLKEPLWRIVKALDTQAPFLCADLASGQFTLPLPLSFDANHAMQSDLDGAQVGHDSDAYSNPPVHKRVWEAIGRGANTTDKLIDLTGLDSASVRCAITKLEMLGFVQRGPGDTYRKVARKR